MAKKDLGKDRFRLRLKDKVVPNDPSMPRPLARISDLTDEKRSRHGKLRGPNDGRSRIPVAKRSPQRETDCPRFRDRRYILVASCPSCGRCYSRPEVLNMFSDNPDFPDVKCLDCGASFGATIVLPGMGSWCLYGPEQIKRGVAQKGIQIYMDLSRHPSLFNSLVFIVGGAEAAAKYFKENLANAA